MDWPYLLSGFFGLAAVAAFIAAIRTSYAIERLIDPPDKWGFPVMTDIFATAFGSRGRGRPEVDALRRRLRALLLASVCLLGAIALGARFAQGF